MPWTTGAQIDGEFLELYSKILPLLLLIFAIFLTGFFGSRKFLVTWEANHKLLNPTFYFFSNKWYFDTIYNSFVVRPFIRAFAKSSFRYVDKGYLELFSLKLLPAIVKVSGHGVLFLQTGYLPFHVGFLATWLLGLLIYLV